MRKSILIIKFLVICLALTNCENDEIDPNVTMVNSDDTASCEQVTIVSGNEYRSAISTELTINDLQITDDCLKINFSSAGCDGDSWVIKLIASEGVLESLPPQRNLILSLENEETCKAIINKELTFDISNLKVDEGPVLLNITNTGDSILYTY